MATKRQQRPAATARAYAKRLHEQRPPVDDVEWYDRTMLDLERIGERAELVAATLTAIVEQEDRYNNGTMQFLPGLALVAQDISDASDEIRESCRAMIQAHRRQDGTAVPAVVRAEERPR